MGFFAVSPFISLLLQEEAACPVKVVFYYTTNTTYTKASIERRDGIVFYFAYGTEVILDVM